MWSMLYVTMTWHSRHFTIAYFSLITPLEVSDKSRFHYNKIVFIHKSNSCCSVFISLSVWQLWNHNYIPLVPMQIISPVSSGLPQEAVFWQNNHSQAWVGLGRWSSENGQIGKLWQVREIKYYACISVTSLLLSFFLNYDKNVQMTNYLVKIDLPVICKNLISKHTW